MERRLLQTWVESLWRKKCYFIASSSLKIKCGKSKGMQEKVSIMGVMPISDPRDRFFYLHHTPMKDTYILSVFNFKDIYSIYFRCLNF